MYGDSTLRVIIIKTGVNQNLKKVPSIKIITRLWGSSQSFPHNLKDQLFFLTVIKSQAPETILQQMKHGFGF